MAGRISGAGSYDFGGGVKITMRYGSGVLVKYESSGAPQWARTVNADNPSASSSFYSVAVDAGGNVYAAGDIYHPGSYDFGGGVKITVRYQSGVLVKYDSSGTAQWARTVTLALD
jgi:hypothetical protein